jgi:hypothetical protein
VIGPPPRNPGPKVRLASPFLVGNMTSSNRACQAIVHQWTMARASDVYSPLSGTKIGAIGNATAEDVHRAISAAVIAFRSGTR